MAIYSDLTAEICPSLLTRSLGRSTSILRATSPSWLITGLEHLFSYFFHHDMTFLAHYSVPRSLEKRIRDWVRFQFTESQQETKVEATCYNLSGLSHSVFFSLRRKGSIGSKRYDIIMIHRRNGACSPTMRCPRSSSWLLPKVYSKGSSPLYEPHFSRTSFTVVQVSTRSFDIFYPIMA